MILREPYSGVEVTVHGLAVALAEHGTLPLNLHLPPQHRALPQVTHVTHSYAKPLWTRTRLLRILWEQLALPQHLRRTGAALLHAPAYVAPLLAPCPVVLTIHDLHVLTHPHFCRRSNRLHYRLLLPPSLRYAAAIIVFSTYTKRTILTHFPTIPTERIRVIPPGITLSHCSDPTTLRTVTERYCLPPTFILFVGDFTQRKNLTGIIESFATLGHRYPEVHLVLAGAHSGATAAALEQLAARLGLRARLHLTGYVAQSDLAALYSLAVLLLFPSHDEGFGLPPLEALACGCPVVCAGGAPVENCGTAALHCDPTDPHSIAAAVATLLENPTLRREKIVAGYQQAAKFTWQAAAQATERLYRQLVALP